MAAAAARLWWLASAAPRGGRLHQHRGFSQAAPTAGVRQLAPWVTRVLGDNPGPTTLDGALLHPALNTKGTCTYLVGRGKVKALIDTATGGPEYVRRLRAAMAATGTERIAAIFLTHWHRDHTDGLKDLLPGVLGPPAPPPAATDPIPEVVDLAQATAGGDRPRVYKLPGQYTPGLAYTPLRAGQRFRLPPDASGQGSMMLEVLPAPGHAGDDACYWVESERAAFTGDLVLGSNSSVLFDDLTAHLASLDALARREPRLLLPGHGEPVENGAADQVRRSIRHRLQREADVLTALAAQPGGATAAQVVEAVYRGYPAALQALATGTVVLHLLKLERDNRVARLTEAAAANASDRVRAEAATTKGPGGLTILQIHGFLRENQHKDRAAQAVARAFRPGAKPYGQEEVHPCHVGLEPLFPLKWQLRSKKRTE